LVTESSDVGIGVKHSNHDAGNPPLYEALCTRNFRVISGGARFEGRVHGCTGQSQILSFFFQGNKLRVSGWNLATVCLSEDAAGLHNDHPDLWMGSLVLRHALAGLLYGHLGESQISSVESAKARRACCCRSLVYWCLSEVT
jgi:hypothetical protein